MVGAAARYLRVEVWQGGKIGVRRAAVIIGRKSPVFVDFLPPDTENFGPGLLSAHGRRPAPASATPVSCSIRWDSSHPGDMHGLVILHGRLPGIAKEGQTLLLLVIGKTCVIS